MSKTTDNGYTKIYSTQYAFAALKADGSITAWGSSNHGGTGAPLSGSYTKIYSNGYAFAALKADGSITTWGGSESGGTNASNVPTDKGYIRIYSTSALRAAKAY
jgi:transcription elongation factor